MSHHLYSTRLLWQGTRGGIAKLRGLLVTLTAPPDIGVRLVAVDYIPEVGLRQIMRYAQPWGDMTDDEVRAADAALASLTAQAGTSGAIGRRAWQG